MRDHPEGIRSVVLDSTVAPRDYRQGGYWGQARESFPSEVPPFSSERAVLRSGRRAFPRYRDSVRAQPPTEPFIFDDCRGRDVLPDPAARQPTRSDIPTLLLSVTFDFRRAR